MINVQNLNKRFGDQVLFEEVSFHLNQGEKAGLVGRNGHGKTTLFRILTGQERPDGGDIAVPRHYRIGCLDQIIDFQSDTILEEGCRGLQSRHRTDENTWKAKKVLTGLGFSEDDFLRHPGEFSSGYRMRISLAKTLISEPNLLLLDEPTNFLDILSIRWLIDFLNRWNRELIVISHDRSFMDSVTSLILGLHRRTLKKVYGSTGTYYRQLAKEEELYEKQRLNQEKKKKQMDDFINRFRAKARHASLVQSRKKTMAKLEPHEKLEAISTLSFSFNYAPCRAKCLMEASRLVFSYHGERPYLIEDFSLSISNRDRICIIGKNGQGKSTLLRLLAGKLPPLKGEIKTFPQSRFTYFEQAETEHLDPGLTVEDQILASMDSGDRQQARKICGAMMFPGDDAMKSTGILSGGEKSRVLLGKTLVSPANLIFMDEPTQHLDMESCEALTDAVGAFPGAACIVTHNERILRQVATRLVVFHRNRLFVFNDGYERFLEEIGWEDEAAMRGARAGDKRTTRAARAANRKEMKQKRAEFVERRGRTLKPLEEALTRTERAISDLESRLKRDNTLLVEACHRQNADEIARLSQAVQHAEEELEGLYEHLVEQEERYDEARESFAHEESELFE